MLEPLAPAAALEMVGVLADARLYRHTGGAPPGLFELKERYERQELGRSPDGSERWVNWIIRLADSNAAVGYIQATIVKSDGSADVAWVVGTPHQGRGYATEAARAAVEWLRHDRAMRITAHIAAANHASQAVARKIGLEPTAKLDDGETVWKLRG